MGKYLCFMFYVLHGWGGFFLDFYETCEYNCGCGVSYFMCMFVCAWEITNINKYK